MVPELSAVITRRCLPPPARTSRCWHVAGDWSSSARGETLTCLTGWPIANYSTLYLSPFAATGIPSREVKDISAWQRCHLGLVVPLADAYALSETPDTIWTDRSIIRKTALALRGNMKALRRERVRLDPKWLHGIRLLPLSIVIIILRKVFASRFASVFMRPHATSGREEMAFLHELFYSDLHRQRRAVNCSRAPKSQ